MIAALRRIAETSVTADLLKEASNAVSAAVSDRQASGETIDPCLIVISHFRGRSLSIDTLTAVVFRMEALCQLIVDGELRHWRLGGADSDGGVTMNEAVYEAAARARLLVGSGPKSRPRFKSAPFRDLLLKLSVSSEGGTHAAH